MTPDQALAIAFIRPIAEMMADLSVSMRINLLSALLMQEVCNHPPDMRPDVLAEIIADLPDILSLTEDGMRRALAENARDR